MAPKTSTQIFGCTFHDKDDKYVLLTFFAVIFVIICIVLGALGITKTDNGTHCYVEEPLYGWMSRDALEPGLNTKPLAAIKTCFRDKITVREKTTTVHSRDIVKFTIRYSVQYVANRKQTFDTVHAFGSEGTMFKFADVIIDRITRDVSGQYDAIDFIGSRTSIENAMQAAIFNAFAEDLGLGVIMRLFTLTNIQTPQAMNDEAVSLEHFTQAIEVVRSLRGPELERATGLLNEAREDAARREHTANLETTAAQEAATIARDASVFRLESQANLLLANAQRIGGTVIDLLDDVLLPEQIPLELQVCLANVPDNARNAFVCYQQQGTPAPSIILS